MKLRGCHIVLSFLVALAFLASCRGPRRIPRREMQTIFYEMFLQDQLVRNNPPLRREADTSLVYEGIFEKHGYDTDDYLYSLHYYIQEPERLAKIMDGVARRFDAEANRTSQEIRFQSWKEKMMGIWLQQPDTLGPQVPPPPADSLFARISRDTIHLRIRQDTLSLPADSLLFYHPADTL